MSAAKYTEPCDTALLPKGDHRKTSDDEKVQMKKELGLLEGVAIILGIIFGSGLLLLLLLLFFFN